MGGGGTSRPADTDRLPPLLLLMAPLQQLRDAWQHVLLGLAASRSSSLRGDQIWTHSSDAGRLQAAGRQAGRQAGM
jgi:hypothetical protein